VIGVLVKRLWCVGCGTGFNLENKSSIILIVKDDCVDIFKIFFQIKHSFVLRKLSVEGLLLRMFWQLAIFLTLSE